MQTLKVLLKAANFCVSLVVILTMCAAGAFSVYALWDNSQVYRAAGDVQASMLHLKPQADPTAAEGPTFDELLAVNPDVCAWLTLDGTNIDYPVLQGESNLSYINTDVYGNFALAGSIFLDSRNSSTFADVFSLLYGHHMENSQMFGDLDKYRSVDFLQQTNTGTLLVPGGRYALRVFACIVVSASDDLIYQPLQWQADNVPAMLDRLQADALCVDQAAMDDLRTAQNLKVLCMSTCSSDYTDARTVVLAAMQLERPQGGTCYEKHAKICCRTAGHSPVRGAAGNRCICAGRCGGDTAGQHPHCWG